MAINSYGNNLATKGVAGTSTPAVKNKAILGKDDFMKLLLVQLQHQDPTEPMDAEKILTQTSQLASLESTENTNKALATLAASLSSTQQFSTIAAIGKTANLGSDAITHKKGSKSSFEVYFPSSIKKGKVNITDLKGNKIATIDVGTNSAGVYKFDWDGKTSAGKVVESGKYRVNADYSTPEGKNLKTRLGAYPIESVRFENGKTYVKVGSNYVPLARVVEVY